MRALAALLVFMSFLATHAAGEAFARVQDPVSTAVATAPATLDLGVVEVEACCPADEAASQSEPTPCQQGDCLFLLPVLTMDFLPAPPAIGVHDNSGLTDLPGRMPHPPPIS